MRQPETLLHIGDGKVRVERPSRPPRRRQQQSEAFRIVVDRLAVGKGLRPFGEIEAGIVNVDEQVARSDAKRGCNANELVRPRNHFAAFDLGQSDIGDFG
ncbi:hypothetical protein D9M73_120490 [compost metagenome]